MQTLCSELHCCVTLLASKDEEPGTLCQGQHQEEQCQELKHQQLYAKLTDFFTSSLLVLDILREYRATSSSHASTPRPSLGTD